MSAIVPSKEMIALFEKRTKHHIALVKKNLLQMEGYLGIDINFLQELACMHDKSKYDESERISYIWMTWMYYCKNNNIPFTYPKNIEQMVFQGWQHHLCHNSHHPEAHASHDAMTDANIIEMIADWTAISQENNHSNGSCYLWAEENIDKKWNFSVDKKQLIFKTIQEMDYRNGKNRS
jgi:hypothetical protein